MNAETAEFLLKEVCPRIRSMTLTPIGCEDREELCQDAIATAAKLLASTQARNKKVTPGNVVFYAIGLVRQGRRSGGQSTTDALSPRTQIVGRSTVLSLDAALSNETEGGEEPMCLHDALAAPVEDPAITASRRLDWANVMRNLDGVALAILVCLATGEPLTKLVPKLKCTRSNIQNDKNRLARLLRKHLGEDILQQVQEVPRWRDNLEATRAKSACRYERQPA
ncbi:MAG: hypothetical protein ACREIC_01050 [Limisphaerales bacterium]